MRDGGIFMNKNKRTAIVPEDLKITITDKGLKINKSVTYSEIVNTTVNGLLALTVSQSNDENRESLYALMSTAFANALASFAPDLYFPSEEELEQEARLMEIAAAQCPDISDKIEEVKAKVAEHINVEDQLKPGEAVAFSESGKVCYPVEEA